MIKFENTIITGWEAAVRGMRNPMNSWEKIDSSYCSGRGAICDTCAYKPEDDYIPCYLVPQSKGNVFVVGKNDLNLMQTLNKAGTDHAKFMRFIDVTVDITAPLYWWKEFDTYKVGTVANSCSTMHKIHAKEFTIDDFSHEHLTDYSQDGELYRVWLGDLEDLIYDLNFARAKYIETKDKKYWWQMIQLLPTSYNQKRTVHLNYQVIKAMYNARKNHKLDEWSIGFINWAKSLPYSKELITGEE